ncbi:1-phosphofructokinase [Sporosarcina sp.]|uniref:1-phosphofructokinase n=1 Tax=Sporosarcina sp. TaxID=49982 RepID=UPI002621D5C3|nr:1-phosphofructokinase [Sporosarcina sp.]
MILTVTMNPSVDIRYNLEHFNLDAVNRVANVSKTAGGKGLNVSRVLIQLGEEVAATGFLGGSLGSFIRTQISDLLIKDRFIDSIEDTRNCIAIIHDGQQTEVLESGPVISEKEQTEFLEQFRSYVKNAEIVTVSGSLPKGLDTNFYTKLLEIAQEHDAKVLLDTSGEALKVSLESVCKPYLIKPNEDELADIAGKEINTKEQVIEALQNPVLDGIPWIVVTLGGQGALIRHEDQFYQVQIPKVEVKNPVGSGDSVIAGFAAGIRRKLADEELIKFGISMGVLNAMEEKTGHIDPQKIEWCTDQIDMKKITI